MNFEAVPSGEIVAVKYSELASLVTYDKSWTEEVDGKLRSRHRYSIGHYILMAGAKEHLLLRFPTSIDTLILKVFNSDTPILDSNGDEIDVQHRCIIFLVEVLGVCNNENERLEKIKEVIATIKAEEAKLDESEDEEDSYSSSLDRRQNPYDDYRHELDDMNEADPTWRIANDLD